MPGAGGKAPPVFRVLLCFVLVWCRGAKWCGAIQRADFQYVASRAICFAVCSVFVTIVLALSLPGVAGGVALLFSCMWGALCVQRIVRPLAVVRRRRGLR